jgi:hypothetical protein
MNRFARCALSGAAALALTTSATESASGQAFSYPSFQPPRVTTREFNFAVADAGATSLVFQWREGIEPRMQLSFDLGIADPDGPGNSFFLLGGQFAAQLAEAKPDLPLDFLFTAGVNVAVSSGNNIFRIPFGLSLGHRFALDQGMAITPYAHPRLSLDRCGSCRVGDRSRTELGVDFDLGVNFEITRQLAFRASALIGGSDLFGNHDGFGISVAWTAAGLRPRR